MQQIFYHRHNLAILLLLLNTFLFSVASGINIISLPLIIYKHSVPTSLMGVSSAIEISAGILIARFLHNLGKKMGLFKMMARITAINAIVILLIPFYINFSWWLVLIFLNGMSWFSFVTLRQSWINGLIGDEKRAKILGIFSSAMCIGLTIGPILTKLIGAGLYLNFITSASFILMSFLTLIPIRDYQPKIEKSLSENQIIPIIKRNYQTFLARFLLDCHNIVLAVFTVIYGMHNKLSAEDAGLLVSAFMGIGTFDFLIGFLIKSNSYRKYFTIGFLGCLGIIIIMPILMKHFHSAILGYMAYGWFSSLIFITAMSAANTNQKEGSAVAVNAALQASGSFGSLVGILIAGLLIETYGKHGFIIAMATPSIVYLIINFLTKIRNRSFV